MMLTTLVILMSTLSSVAGQCTWPSTFASSTWHDGTRGDVTFSTTTMSGWMVLARSQTFNDWECVDNSSSSLIVMRATTLLTYSSLSFYVFACLSLTKITDVSYYYYLLSPQQSNGGYERLRFSQTNTLTTAADICDYTASVPTQEFHVLVKSGSESSAAITCPTQFLYTADYTYTDTSTSACADSVDSWDVCTDTTEMTFNYTACSQTIAYSAGGKLWCVASVGDCAVLYNQDASLTTTTKQFACLCSNGESVAVTAGNCTATQTPGVIPTGPDGVSAIGYLLTVGAKSVDCAPTSSSSSPSSGGGLGAGAIVGIVIGLLLLIAIVIIIFFLVRHKKKKGKNRVTESSRPILLDKENARVETVTETSRANGKLSREKSSLSQRGRERSSLSRERSSLSREGSRLDKSMVDGRASVTSIGLEQKSEKGLSREKTGVSKTTGKGVDREKSTVTLISVKPTEPEEKEESASPVKSLFARLPCWPKEPEPEKQTETEPPKTPEPIAKKGAGKKGTKKTPAPEKEGKGKGGKKGGKKGTKACKATKNDKGDKKVKDGKVDIGGDLVVTDAEQDSPKATPRDAPKDTPQTPKDKPKSPRGTPRTPKDTPNTPKATPKSKENGPKFTSTPIPKDATEKAFLTDGKMPTFISTPIPKDSKDKSFTAGGKMPTFVSMPSNLQKPEDKKTGWPFLVCCAGGNDPLPDDPPPPEQEPVVVVKKPLKGKAAGKGKAKPAKKPAEKKAGKKKSAKPDTNGKAQKDTKEPEGENETDKLDRANTMPERAREKTTLSLLEAEKVKVDVYVPNEQTQLQLKDTVTVVKDKNGSAPMEKAKTTLGLTRPESAKSQASKSSAAITAGKLDKPAKKGKAKGGKEKKDGAKKKKKK